MWRGVGRLALWSGGIGVVLAVLTELIPLSVHFEVFQAWQRRAWTQRLRELSTLLYEYRETSGAWLAHPEVLVLRYNSAGQLREWNTTHWPIPSDPPSLGSPAPELLSGEQSLYYALKLFSDTSVQVVLIPIWIHPPQSGLYRRWVLPVGGDWKWIQSLCVSRRGEGKPLVFPDLSGQPLLRLYVECPEALRYPWRIGYVSLLGIAGVAGLLLLWGFLRRRRTELQARLLFLAVLFGVWQLLHWLELPGSLVPSSIFSAEQCAITPLHTSVWDIAWTLSILLWATTLLPLLRAKPSGIVYLLGYWGAWGAFGGGLYLLVQHSQLELDPVQEWGLMELLGWTIALALFWRVLQFLGKVFHPFPWAVLLIGGAFAVGVAFYIGLPWWAITAILLLYVSPLSEKLLPRFVLHTAQALFLVVGINGWITWGQERRIYTIMEAYAPQVLQLRDPALEYRMAQALQRLASDTVLWRTLSVEEYLIDAHFIAKIIQKHFLFLGEQQDILLSCWSEEGLRLDNLFETRPLVWKQIAPHAERTMAPNLYFIKGGWPRYFYLARVPVELPDLPRLVVQIELYPRKEPLRSRLYPPENNPQARLSYALYEGGRLIRRWGAAPFPAYLPGRVSSGPTWQRNTDFYEYFLPTPRGLQAYLKYPVRDRAAHLATLPLLLALLAAVILGENFSGLWQLFRSLYAREGPIALQLRALFWALVALPLFGLVGVTFVLFLRLSQDTFRRELYQRLTTVSGYLSGDPVLLEKLAYGLRSYIPAEESFVRDLMRRVAYLSNAEAFLYNHEGHLYSSTLPRAYWGRYAALLLEPSLLQSFRRPTSEAIIQVDSKGNRLLGYVPLRTAQGRTIGILHIPMPLPVQSFYEPLRYFIGYAVNVYLVLIWGSTLVGLLLIQRFSEGLERIVEQLRAVPEVPNPPTLQWRGKGDEIATLVAAYNDMAERLRANQKQLEATLRRVSQQEMAFQAAHEIKTALTPLKIHLQHLQRIPTVEPDKLRDIATRLLQRIEALVRIANAFMSFARLGSPEELPLSPLSLSHFLEEHLHPYLQNSPVPVELRLPEVPVWVLGHADALQQVLNNLLQNALQALEGHPSPRIVVTLSQEAQGVVLAVQDNGPGIPPEVRERIFEFYFTTRRSGTGLGLAITKGLVERMGARISFTSEVGLGTTFYVVFPPHTP